MQNKSHLLILFCFVSTSISAQNLKIVDSKTMEAIPFFHLYDPQKINVMLGGPDGSISLEELQNTFSDSMFISHLGYETLVLRKRDLDQTMSEIQFQLKPLVFELDEANAQILDEVELFEQFQTKLENQLSKNSWLVRVHFWEFIDDSEQVIEQYGLMGFGGLIERKGKFGKYDHSNYFLLSEYARKNSDLEFRGWHNTKNLFGVLLNEILFGIIQTKSKKVNVLSSSREKLTFAITYGIEELGIELMISENAELLEINWAKDIKLNISDSIQFGPGKIRFYPNSDLLVPIAINLKYQRQATGKQHEFYLLSSIIPSQIDYRQFLNKNYAVEDYYKLMVNLGDFDDYFSGSSFFQSSKARFASNKMAQFSGKTLNNNLEWVDTKAVEEIGKRNLDEAANAKIPEFYKYKIHLLNEYKKLGLTW